MGNLILANTSSQTCLAICESYKRLTGIGYVGPTGICTDPLSGFCIQSPNKNIALYVANSYTAFANGNTLGFNLVNQPTNICLYNNQSFCITDNYNGGTYFRVGPNNCLLFGTGSNACTFSINSNGVGIGTSTPVNKLDVRGCTSSYVASTLWNDYSATAANSYPYSIFQMGVKSGSNLAYINQYVQWNNGSPFYHISNQCVCTFYSNFNNYVFRDYNDIIMFASASNGTSFQSNFCILGNQSNRASGDFQIVNMMNCKLGGEHIIDYWNGSGGAHSSLRSAQKLSNSGSYFLFQNAPVGMPWNVTNARQSVLCLSEDRNAYFYGNLCSLTGCFNFISGSGACVNGNIEANYICTNGLINKGARTTFGADGAGYHWFAAFPYTSELSLGYGFGRSLSSNSQTGYVTEHSWYSSGSSLMYLTPSSLQVSGVICSNSGLKITGSSANNIYGKSLCIALTDTNYNLNINGNQCLNGNILATGSASFNSIISTGTSTNLTSCICHSLCVVSCSYLNSISYTNETGTISCSTMCVDTNTLLATSICQKSTSTSNICLYGNLNVGSTCSGAIRGINTAKAWGMFNLANGTASILCGYNFTGISFVNTAANALLPSGTTGSVANYTVGTGFASMYSIKFATGIKPPFSISFSVFDPLRANYFGGTSPNFGSGSGIFSTNRLSDFVMLNSGSYVQNSFAYANYKQIYNTSTNALNTDAFYDMLITPILSDTCNLGCYMAPYTYINGLVSFQIFGNS